MKFNVYTDPSHGWVKVPKKFLKKIGIADVISSCSYMKGDYAYLEEDCDFKALYETMKHKNIPIELKESHTNKQSKIRNYDSYVNYTSEEEEEIKDLRKKMLSYTIWAKKIIVTINNASLETLRFWQTYYKL